MKNKFDPNLDHVKCKDFENVYEPNTDTFAFVDALEKDFENLVKMNPGMCLEIGPGSGYVSTFLSKMLASCQIFPFFLGVDVNLSACEMSSATFSKNGVLNGDIIQGNLVDSIRLENRVDVLLFNPPYVPSEDDEVFQSDIRAAWAGGLDGREIINLLFPIIHKLLSQNGVFYLVTIEENNPRQLCKSFLNMQGKILLKRVRGEEILYILKFTRD